MPMSVSVIDSNGSVELARTKTLLEAQVRQQAAVADLGQQALAGADLESLFDSAVHCVSETLGIEYCKVLELLPDRDILVLRAGIGWETGHIGVSTVSASSETQAGRTLLANEPIIIEDWQTETRFKPSRLLRDHAVTSGLSVSIGGRTRPFGILSADAVQKRKFTHYDIYFLQAIANVLAAAIEQRQTEELLRQQADLLELAQEPIFAWEFDGGIIFWNRGSEQLYGYSRAEALGQVSQQLLKTVYPIPLDEFRETLARERQWVGEIKQTVRDERQITVQSRHMVMRDSRGRWLVLETNHDITERKQAEETLRNNHALLQTIIQATDDPIYLKDLEGRYMMANAATAEVIGNSVEEIIGKTDREIFTPELSSEIMAHDRQVMQDGQPYAFENEVITPKGIRNYHSHKAPHRDAAGRTIGLIGVSRDITDLKQVELSHRLLAEAGKVLSTSLGYRARLSKIAQLAVPDLADWCSVDILEADASVHQVVIAHADPAKVELAQELRERYPPDWNADVGAAHVLRTGESRLYPDISEEMMVASAQDEQHLQIIRDVQMSSAMIVPLRARGQIFGVMTFVWAESKRHYDENDLALAEELARRAATAIDNARLYETEREARRAAERATKRIASLQAITAALSEALTPTAVAEVITKQGLTLVGADSGLVALLDEAGTSLEIIHHFGYSAEAVKDWLKFPLSTSVPLAETVRTGQPIFIESSEMLAQNYPEFANQRVSTYQALATMPLLIEGQALGGIALSFAEARTFGPEERSFMLAVTQQCTQAIERARLYEAEQQARAEAEAAQQRLAAMAEVKERHRLAQELHDTVAQALGYLNLKMSAAHIQLAQEDIEGVQVNLTELKQIIGETYTDVREEIFNLRSTAAPGVQFLNMLKEYVDKYKRFYDLDVSLVIEADKTIFEFPDEVGIQLIRTIQEALINIRKHAKVDRAKILLDRQDEEVCITIADRGRGFDLQRLRGEGTSHFGLEIMEERMARIDGRFEIESTPGEGTQVRLYYQNVD